MWDEAWDENRRLEVIARSAPADGVKYPAEHRIGNFWEALADLDNCASLMLCDLLWANAADWQYPLAGELAQRALSTAALCSCGQETRSATSPSSIDTYSAGIL
jgi:hypothetical protein